MENNMSDTKSEKVIVEEMREKCCGTGLTNKYYFLFLSVL